MFETIYDLINPKGFNNSKHGSFKFKNDIILSNISSNLIKSNTVINNYIYDYITSINQDCEKESPKRKKERLIKLLFKSYNLKQANILEHVRLDQFYLIKQIGPILFLVDLLNLNKLIGDYDVYILVDYDPLKENNYNPNNIVYDATGWKSDNQYIIANVKESLSQIINEVNIKIDEFNKNWNSYNF